MFDALEHRWKGSAHDKLIQNLYRWVWLPLQTNLSQGDNAGLCQVSVVWQGERTPGLLPRPAAGAETLRRARSL